MAKTIFPITLDEEIVKRLRQEYKGSAASMINRLLIDYFNNINKKEQEEDKTDKLTELDLQLQKLQAQKNEAIKEVDEMAELEKRAAIKKEEQHNKEIERIATDIKTFFIVDIDEARGWAKQFIEENKINPMKGTDYFTYFSNKGLKERL